MTEIKVIFRLPQEMLEFLQKQAAREHVTVTEMLYRSVNAERFFVEQEDAGNRVFVEDKDRRFRQVLRC